MIYSFQVFHSELAKGDDKRTWEKVLGEEEILLEYAQFGTPFEYYFLEKPRIGATFKAADLARDGLVVTLETDLDTLAVTNILAEFLVRQNRSIPGLCLIGNRIKPGDAS